MNLALSRLLKSAYRREPISAFIFLFGIVQALMGGVSERWTLLSLGIVLLIISGTLRWLKVEQAKKVVNPATARRYLSPSRSPLQPLPELKKHNYRS